MFSGNCVIDDDGVPTFIYTGRGSEGRSTATGILARSYDGMLTWEKKLIMDQPPYPGTPVHWDAQIWKDGDTWYQLIGGTYEGSGAAVLWSSPDLENWTYRNRIHSTDKYGYFWELPYLLRFGEKHVLIFGIFGAGGLGRYWVGNYDKETLTFTPDDEDARVVDASRHFYAPNVHLADNRGPGGSERRLMFGWVRGEKSPTPDVPYWQGNHSLPRVLTLEGDRLVQKPIPEVQALRYDHRRLEDHVIASGAPQVLRDFTGDALEIQATFDPQNAMPKRFGVRLSTSRDNRERVSIYYEPATRQFGIAVTGEQGDVSDEISDVVTFENDQPVKLHIFLDRSVVEVFAGGQVLTRRVYVDPANQGVDVFSEGGMVKLEALDLWRLKSIWKSSP